MELNAIILQIGVIFLPGLVWASLASRYAAKRQISEFQYLLQVFIFGTISYIITFASFHLFGKQFALADINEAVKNNTLTAATMEEVGIATVAGLILGIVWLYIKNHKVDTWFLHKIRATGEIGEDDIWNFTFNSPIAQVEYCHFRDFENKLVYAGWVSQFSEKETLRELVLRNVEVYDLGGNLLYTMPLVYLARKPDSIHIEFPHEPRENEG
jgi:hypothetical protein